MAEWWLPCPPKAQQEQETHLVSPNNHFSTQISHIYGGTTISNWLFLRVYLRNHRQVLTDIVSQRGVCEKTNQTKRSWK